MLAHPVSRTRLLLAKAAAIAVEVAVLGIACRLGLVISVALAGGGIGPGRLAALALHLTFLALAFGALALAIGGVSGRRTMAAGGAAAVAVAIYLLNGLAPVTADWLQYLSLFHYYEGHEPLRVSQDANAARFMPVRDRGGGDEGMAAWAVVNRAGRFGTG